MKIVAFSSECIEGWNACCDDSDQAWLFHRGEWIDIEVRHFGAVNHSFAIVDSHQIVAIQPLYFAEIGLGLWTERLLHSGFHRHTGLALKNGLTFQQKRIVRRVAMKQIEQLAGELLADRIQLNVQNLAPESLSLKREEIPSWVIDDGFQLGLRYGPMGINPFPGATSCAADQIVDLSQDEEMMFSRIDDSCRRAIRKAESAPLATECWTGNLTEAIGHYYELAVISSKRTGEAIAGRPYFEELALALGSRARLALIFSRYEGKRVAAVLLGIDKKCTTFLGGVSDPDFLHLRPNDFTHWSAMRWARNEGLIRYRFGPTFPEFPGDWPISKVSRFKAKFGADSFTTIQGSKFLNVLKYQGQTSLLDAGK